MTHNEPNTSPDTEGDASASTDKHSLTLSTDAEVEEGIREIMDRIHLSTRHAVGRAALRAGIRVLVADPTKAIDLILEQRRPAGGAR